jgi:hypothetical protein
VREDTGGEALADGAGDSAVEVVADAVDLVGPVGLWRLAGSTRGWLSVQPTESRL